MWHLPTGTAQSFTLTVRWQSGSGLLLCRFLSDSQLQRETNFLDSHVDLGRSPATHTGWCCVPSAFSLPVCLLYLIVCLCVRTCVCLSVYVHIGVCISVHLYMYVCMCVLNMCVSACMCLVCLCVHIHIIFTLMCVGYFDYTYVCTTSMPDSYRGQKGILDPLELELWMVVNYCSENQTPEQPVLSTPLPTTSPAW